jgi:hypothetical protein
MKVRTGAELIIGGLYAIGAVHQSLFVLRESRGFYDAMAEQAWLPPAEALIEQLLVPNSVTVTALVAVFQAAVAIAILTRGAAVRPALVAGGVFSVIGALTGSPAETVGYGILAAIQFKLASDRKSADPAAAPED